MKSEQVEISDGGEQTIKCSDCNKPLLHYRIYVPTAPLTHKLKASCPFCDGKSFLHTITGLIYVGPIGKEESLTPTKILDINTNSETGMSEFKMARG